MSKMGTYQPIEKYKNYSLSTTKPHAFYEEKVWTLQEQIHKRLKKVADLLESLYPKLTDDFSGSTKMTIQKHLATLIEDLDLMQGGLHKNPYTFNTNQLKTNQHCITEMKHVCDTLQSVKSYEHEHKRLSQIKHALHELEHLIQPTSFEKSLEKAGFTSKLKKTPSKGVKSQKQIKAKSAIKSAKQKAITKKIKPSAKVIKPKKAASKKPKSKEPTHKLKQSEKKLTKSKPKLSAKPKKALAAKAKPKIKSASAHKTKYGVKAQESVEKAMHKMKQGKLESGKSHKKVTDRKQAIAIGLSEARKRGAKVPKKSS